MKLSPVFALALVLISQSAMAQPEETSKPAAPSAEAVTFDTEDINDDICWVAPEWREVSR